MEGLVDEVHKDITMHFLDIDTHIALRENIFRFFLTAAKTAINHLNGSYLLDNNGLVEDIDSMLSSRLGRGEYFSMSDENRHEEILRLTLNAQSEIPSYIDRWAFYHRTLKPEDFGLPKA